MKCVRIHSFEKHEDDITKLNQAQSQSLQNEVSTSIINSARLSPGRAAGINGGRETSKRGQFRNCNDKEEYQFIPTNKHLIYSDTNQILAIKPLAVPAPIGSGGRSPLSLDTASNFCAPPPETYSVHEKPILHMATSVEGWLLVTCSEDSIILWKWDSLLKNWSHYRVGVAMSRTTSVATCYMDKRIYITIGHATELLVIECVNADDLSSRGFLNLATISKYAVLDKLTEVNTWLSSMFLNDTLHIVGFSSNRGVAIKVWQVSDKTIKLKFRQPLLLKTLVTADVFHDVECGSFYAVGASADGSAEAFFGSPSTLTLINRIKIEEPPQASSSFSTTASSNIEFRAFRVMASKFFIMDKCLCGNNPTGANANAGASPAESKDDAEAEGAAGVVLPELDNSLALPKPASDWCPKLYMAVASTLGLSVVDVRSGDYELHLNYKGLDFIGNTVVSNAQLAVNTCENAILVAIQPLLQNTTILTFRAVFEKCDKFNALGLPDLPEEPLSLVPTEAVSSKSVLRKKIKSPTRSFPGAGVKSKIKSPTGVTAASSSKTRASPSTPHAHPEFNSSMILPSSVPSSEPQSVRPSRSSSTLNLYAYSSRADLSFDENSTKKTKIESQMSNSLSCMRMAFTSDGNHLAACGNESPLVIFKISPKCQSIGTFRDSAKASSIGFSFSTKYMVLAYSTGKTVVLNWKNGYKQLGSLEFNSKFNEHIHAQFYYMDKFILQPEDNRIALYSCRLDEGRPVQKLKAGSFTAACQNITALAAANQLYSNLIFFAGSNKSLNVFDANAEKFKWTVQNAHSKNINCIRLNEAPKGSHAMSIYDYVLTGSMPAQDPIKLWDLRAAKCAVKIADNNVNILATNFTRPALSPCGRYISSAFEEQSVAIYDVRKVNSRLTTFKGFKSSILDMAFDPTRPMLWAGCKNGSLWNFIPQTSETA